MSKKRREHITHRKDLAGEHPNGDMGQLILLILFFVVWIADSFIFRWSTFLQEYVPFYLNVILGLLILYTAVRFVRFAMQNFHDMGETPHVFNDGAFSVVRHPIYLCANLLYIGFFFLTLSIASAILWLIILVFYIFISKHEEKLLLNKFGDDYNAYKKKVPMMFPKIFNRKAK
jgi:protein-S-isoprenylcysteine O-methyltransferase Ste14